MFNSNTGTDLDIHIILMPGIVIVKEVKDKAGNEYVCSAEFLKDPKNVSEEDLKNCVDDASVPQASAGG